MNSRLTVTVSLVTAVVCWLALGYLMISYPPDAVGRILFLCLLALAASFTSAPLTLAIHRRLLRDPDQEAWRLQAVWREAGLFGLFCGLCAWLRLIRVLNWANALLLTAVLVLTEILLLARR